jgi:hypothetical protein
MRVLIADDATVKMGSLREVKRRSQRRRCCGWPRIRKMPVGAIGHVLKSEV